MEHKEIFAVVIAACAVMMLIGIMSMAHNRKNEEHPEPQIENPNTGVVITTAATDIWDVLHNQQTTTTTAVTDENGQPLPDESGMPAETATDALGNPVTDTTFETQVIGSDVIIVTEVPGTTDLSGAETGLTEPAAETATTALQNDQPGYTLVVH